MRNGDATGPFKENDNVMGENEDAASEKNKNKNKDNGMETPNVRSHDPRGPFSSDDQRRDDLPSNHNESDNSSNQTQTSLNPADIINNRQGVNAGAQEVAHAVEKALVNLNMDKLTSDLEGGSSATVMGGAAADSATEQKSAAGMTETLAPEAAGLNLPKGQRRSAAIVDPIENGDSVVM